MSSKTDKLGRDSPSFSKKKKSFSSRGFYWKIAFKYLGESHPCVLNNCSKNRCKRLKQQLDEKLQKSERERKSSLPVHSFFWMRLYHNRFTCLFPEYCVFRQANRCFAPCFLVKILFSNFLKVFCFNKRLFWGF